MRSGLGAKPSATAMLAHSSSSRCRIAPPVRVARITPTLARIMQVAADSVARNTSLSQRSCVMSDLAEAFTGVPSKSAAKRFGLSSDAPPRAPAIMAFISPRCRITPSGVRVAAIWATPPQSSACGNAARRRSIWAIPFSRGSTATPGRTAGATALIALSRS